MKLVIVLACLVGAAVALPTKSAVLSTRQLPALQHEEIHDELGQFALRYVTAEGTIVEQRGRLVHSPDGLAVVMVFDGETTFIGDDGKTYVTKHHAGIDGAHFEGTHLPVAPQPLEVATVPILPQQILL